MQCARTGVTNHFSRIVNPVRSDDDFATLMRDVGAALVVAVDGVMIAAPDALVMGISAETFWDGAQGAMRDGAAGGDCRILVRQAGDRGQHGDLLARASRERDRRQSARVRIVADGALTALGGLSLRPPQPADPAREDDVVRRKDVATHHGRRPLRIARAERGDEFAVVAGLRCKSASV